MGAAPEVRRAGPAEAAEAFALLRRFFAEEGFATPPELLRERLAVFLARRGDAAVGVATATTTFGLEFGRTAELEDLYVLPHVRGGRIGRDLIDAARERCRREGCAPLAVVVTPEGQAARDLRGYYRRHGFRENGRTLLFADPPPGPAS